MRNFLANNAVTTCLVLVVIVLLVVPTIKSFVSKEDKSEEEK